MMLTFDMRRHRASLVSPWHCLNSSTLCSFQTECVVSFGTDFCHSPLLLLRFVARGKV